MHRDFGRFLGDASTIRLARGGIAFFLGMGLWFDHAVAAETRHSEPGRTESRLPSSAAGLDSRIIPKPWGHQAVRPFDGAMARPLRTCVLITGERFHGELLRADRTAVEFRWHGHTRFRVPTAAVAAIENPPGAVDVLDVPMWDGESRSFAIAPVTDGLAQLWWTTEVVDTIRWQLQFGESALEVTLLPSGSLALAVPSDWTTSFRQNLRSIATIPAPSPPSSGERVGVRGRALPSVSEDQPDREHRPERSAPSPSPSPPKTGERGPDKEPPLFKTCIAVRWTETTWDVRIGPALWRQGTKPSGALSHITVSTKQQATASVSNLTVRRFAAERRSSLIEPTDSDAVLLAAGDVWYGEFLRTTGDGVELQGQNDAVALVPWTEFAALKLRPRAGANDLLQPVTGRVREHVGPSLWEPWRLERERWMAADVSPWLASSVVEHPLLGRIALASGDVAHRVAAFPPKWRWLHPQAVHLGNNVQPEFVQPIPHGTRLTGTLTLSALPTEAAMISLDAVGLEPCGTGTPSTQPFFAELQSGALRTELLINGEPVGDWNSRLTYRPRPGSPTRLRLTIPRERFRLGENTWEIRQHPARYDATEFDDCELSRIAFEAD
ncbi:MAG TPA: hypothetical protein VM165_18020 [Planctomycetaceae bacterium]|nr:hypothetical protein [Planctomycetaceae bacterium]